MPLVARLITAAEWQAIEKEHNLDPKSMADLAFEGHWLIEGAGSGDRAAVTGLVPPIPRFILVHGFGWRYRRHAAACWTEGGKPQRRVQVENRVAVTVEADIDQVWDVVRDVTRVGEWSHECVSAMWLPGSASAVPGARTVPTAAYPDSCEWRIVLDKVDGSTSIAQEFRALRAPKVLLVLYAVIIPAHRDRTHALIEDLHRLGAVALQPQVAA